SAVERQTSYEALVGGGTNGISVTITTPPEEEALQRGHSLNSVPEAHEEEDQHHGSRQATRKRAVSESQQALLGDSDSEGRTSRSRIERVEGLEDIELDTRKRRRDS
ncbi:hypothetical protein E0Z10_g10845, partial [Xylaria hypoxylon]